MQFKMFSVFVFSSLLLSFSSVQNVPGIKWHTNYKKVLDEAATTQKPILIFFHGSDWCPPCIRMSREVFSDTSFIDFAADKVLFLDIDFPYKTKLSPSQLAHNKNVNKQFGLPDEYNEGFPQVVIIDPKGKLLYQQKGYEGQGAAYLINKISELLQSNQ